MDTFLILPHESLTCSICYEIVEHPIECNNCHNLFCQNCIKDYLDTKDKYRRLYYCPLCRNKRNNFSENNGVNTILNEYNSNNFDINLIETSLYNYIFELLLNFFQNFLQLIS